MTGVRTTRRVVAVSCIALIVLAAMLPLGGLSLEWLVVTPVFTFLPPITAVAGPSQAPDCDERPVALLSILDSRGPPVRSSLA
jgi:hypothetical protein